MRFLRKAAALGMLLAASGSLGAQSASSCQLVTSDACQKSEDLFTYLVPQLGAALSGGNPILGAGDVLGGLGHFSIGVRASGVWGSLPQFESVSVGTTGRVASDIAVTSQWIPVPVADAAFGIWRGWDVGVTRVGGVDALVSATYLPSVSGDELDFTLDDGNVKVGFGARVGILQEAIIVPAITLTYLQRGLPTLTVIAETEDDARVGVEGLALNVASWRLMATKSFVVFTLSAGFGSDDITTEGTLRANAPGSPVGERVGLDRSVTRSVLFAELSMKLGPATLAVEGGQTKGGSIATFNRFDPEAGAARRFVSLGMRFGF